MIQPQQLISRLNIKIKVMGGNFNPINPFSDPEFKKAIIDKERGSSTGSDDYELLDEDSEGGDVSQDLCRIHL